MMDEVLISVDAAFKAAADSDYVVMQVWGKRGADFFLLDQVRDRMDFPTTCRALETLSAKWPMATAKLIEDKANGPALIAQLKSKIPGLIAVEPRGSKEARDAIRADDCRLRRAGDGGGACVESGADGHTHDRDELCGSAIGRRSLSTRGLDGFSQEAGARRGADSRRPRSRTKRAS